MHYEAGTLEFLQFGGGRVIDVIGTAEYQYLLTDHQGNTRAVWKTDGTLDQTADYYPFGLLHTDPNAGGGSPQNQYLFQGQEHQPELGWVQFKWRNSDPAIGRFFNIDPLSEDYLYNSTYAFSENKLTAHVELEGLEAERANKNERQEMNYLEKVLYTAIGTYYFVTSTIGEGLSTDIYGDNATLDQKSQTGQLIIESAFMPVEGLLMNSGFAGKSGSTTTRRTNKIRRSTNTLSDFSGRFDDLVKRLDNASVEELKDFLRPVDEFDFATPLYRGTGGTNESIIHFTDDLEYARSYVKNGGEVVVTFISNRSLQTLEQAGVLTRKSGEYVDDFVPKLEYEFFGENLRKALMELSDVVE